MRVLFMDARPTECDRFRELVAKDDTDVVLVHSAEDGLARMTQQSFDLVAIGSHLPDVSGPDLMQRILEKDSEQAVFIVIDPADMGRVVNLMALGTVGFLAESKSRDWTENLPGMIRNLATRLSKRRHHLSTLEELETSNQRFRDFADSAGDWLWETNEKGGLVWASHTADEKSGLSVKSVMGLTRQEIAGDLMDPAEWGVYRNAIENHLEIDGFEYSYRGDNGEIRTVAIYGKPLFDSKENYIGHRGAARDVTERNRAEKDLQKALVDAEQANRAKSEFLATMSHEFRTPLNAILGFSEMLRAQYLGPLGAKNYEEYANDIHLSGEPLLALINDILDISAIEAGKRSISPEDVDLADLVDDCIRRMDMLASDKNVEVFLDAPDAMVPVQADRRSIVQILYNILSNAIKFSDEGGQVRLAVTQTDAGYTLSVEDNGVGISDEDLQRITEPFSQVGTDPFKAQEGTGLGLSIVKSLVEWHEGKLEISSEEGIGTRVTVSLPIMQSNGQVAS